jgi:hypothetical protein
MSSASHDRIVLTPLTLLRRNRIGVQRGPKNGAAHKVFTRVSLEGRNQKI